MLKKITIRNEEGAASTVSGIDGERRGQVMWENIYKKVIKKAVITLLCIAGLWVVIRKTYRFVISKITTQKQFIVIQQVPSDQEISGECKPPIKYNYQRTLKLIKQTGEIKKTFQQQFTGVVSKQKPIDLKLTKSLLSDLYREKVRLHRYFIELKVHYKNNVPPKKSRSVLHYQKVINICIKDLETILRQV